MLTREQVLRDLPERVEPARSPVVRAETELRYCQRCRGVRAFEVRRVSPITMVGMFIFLPFWMMLFARAKHRCTVCGRSGGRRL